MLAGVSWRSTSPLVQPPSNSANEQLLQFIHAVGCEVDGFCGLSVGVIGGGVDRLNSQFFGSAVQL